MVYVLLLDIFLLSILSQFLHLLHNRNNFVLIIIEWKPNQEGPGSHALLMGKVKMDKIDISSRPKYDRLNEEEIMLIDTQVGDMHGHHNYVYNLGEAQMMRYLDTYNFKRQHMAVLRLRLDLNDVFSRLSIHDGESQMPSSPRSREGMNIKPSSPRSTDGVSVNPPRLR